MKDNRTRAHEIFNSSPEKLQQLIRHILEEERKVMHKQRRPNIHQSLYEHVKRVIR